MTPLGLASLFAGLALVGTAACVGQEDPAPLSEGPGEGIEEVVPSRPSDVGAPDPLQAIGLVVVPDLRQDTEWLGRVGELVLDPITGHLFALQPGRADVIEFTSEGSLATRFGGTRGRGPGEVQRVVDFAFRSDAVALLDRGNARVLVYGRRGRLQQEFPVPSSYRSVAFFQDRLALLPGADSAAFDLLTIRGEAAGSVGIRSDLPLGCAGAQCGMSEIPCLSCQALAVGPHLAVVNRERAEVSIFGPDGAVVFRKDFLRDDPLVASWVRADEAVRARMEAEERARSPEGVRTQVIKSYFLGASGTPAGLLLLSVVPAAEELREAGFEAWLLDPSDGSYSRFRYPRTGVGFRVAGTPDDGLYALDPSDGGIYGFHSGRR